MISTCPLLACGPAPTMGMTPGVAPVMKPAPEGSCALTVTRDHLSRPTMTPRDAETCAIHCALHEQEACVAL